MVTDIGCQLQQEEEAEEEIDIVDKRGKKDLRPQRREIVGWIWMVAGVDVQESVGYDPGHRVRGQL